MNVKFSLICIVSFFLFSCENKKNEPINDNSGNIEVNSISKPQYVFAVFTIEEPSLKIEKEIDYTAKLEPYDLDLKYKDIYDVEYKKVIYKSEIKEIYNCDDNLKLKFLDDFELELEPQLNLKNMAYYDNLWIKCKDDEAKVLLKDNVCHTLERNIYSFDTYSEASTTKQNLK